MTWFGVRQKGMSPRGDRRRGVMLMFALVLVAMAGILLSQTFEVEKVKKERSEEAVLNKDLEIIRMAIEFDRRSGQVNAAYNAVVAAPNDPQMVYNYLKNLVNRGLIAAVPRDPTVNSEEWGTGLGQKFWRFRLVNVLLNSSFEEGGASPTFWKLDNNVATISISFPRSFGQEDDFPSQNKFGKFMRPGVGQSIKCTAPPP